MTDRQEKLLVYGLLVIGGIVVVSILKGGINNGINSVSNAVANDVKGVGIGGVGAIGSVLLLPPPLDVVGAIGAIGYGIYTIANNSDNSIANGNDSLEPGQEQP